MNISKKRTIYILGLIAFIAVSIVGAILLNQKPKEVRNNERIGRNPADNTFVMDINDRKVTSGPTEYNVKKNSQVVFRFTSKKDQEEDIVLEGYDQNVTISLNATTEINVIADKVGKFNLVSKGMEVDPTDGNGVETYNDNPIILGVLNVTE